MEPVYTTGTILTPDIIEAMNSRDYALTPDKRRSTPGWWRAQKEGAERVSDPLCIGRSRRFCLVCKIQSLLHRLATKAARSHGRCAGLGGDRVNDLKCFNGAGRAFHYPHDGYGRWLLGYLVRRRATLMRSRAAAPFLPIDKQLAYEVIKRKEIY